MSTTITDSTEDTTAAAEAGNQIDNLSLEEAKPLLPLLLAGFSKKAKAQVEHPDFNINTVDTEVLHQSIILGFIDIAEVFVAKGLDLNQRARDGTSLLQLALDREYFGLARQMLLCGAEISIRDDKGWTPLIWAAITGREKIVDFLLENGADIHVCNNDGWNAITGAYVKRHLEIAEKLLSKGAYFGQKYADAVLLSAFKDAQKELFTRMVKDGANVNLVTDKGDPLLSLAISRGDLSSVELLLEHGADPNARLGSGTTCLNQALDNAHYEIAKALLSSGADPNDSGTLGWSPLHYAANHGNAELCSLLIEKGASINKKTSNKGKWTPLTLAANELHLGATKILVELGADLNLSNGDNKRALSLATKYLSNENAVNKYLAQKGALR